MAQWDGTVTQLLYVIVIDESSQNNSGVSVYPNPATDNISVTAKDAASIVIYDITGTLLISQAITVVKNKVDVKSLASGVYFVSVINKTGQFSTVRLVK